MVWVMAGCGTGGHIYPAIALATAAQQKISDLQVRFLGTARSLDQAIFARYGYPFYALPVRPFPAFLLSPKSLPAAFSLLRGLAVALQLFRRWQPTVVIGTGGYASLYALLAGRLVNSVGVLFEANAVPGRANKVLARLADLIATGFPEAVAAFPSSKAYWTGVPIRPDFLRCERESARRALGLGEDERLLVVLGGSQGAKRLNEALWDALPLLLPQQEKLHIVHFCGMQWEPMAQQIRQSLPGDWRHRYQPFGFRDDIAVFLHAADLSVSRAGANAIAELLVAGVPAILVPYPFAIHDHQRFNALSVAKRGAAEMVLDAELTGERLAEEVMALLRDERRRAQMRMAARQIARPSAADDLVGHIQQLLSREAKRRE